MSRFSWLTSGSFVSVLIGWSCFESCLTGFEVVARFSGLTFCPKMFISRLSFYTAVPVPGLACCTVMTVSGLACCTVVTCFRQKPACNITGILFQRVFLFIVVVGYKPNIAGCVGLVFTEFFNAQLTTPRLFWASMVLQHRHPHVFMETGR